MTLALSAFFVFVVSAVVRSRRRKPTTGMEGMQGLLGRTKSELSPRGTVFVDGALWEAVSQQGDLPQGIEINVVGHDGLTLIVRPVTKPAGQAT